MRQGGTWRIRSHAPTLRFVPVCSLAKLHRAVWASCCLSVFFREKLTPANDDDDDSFSLVAAAEAAENCNTRLSSSRSYSCSSLSSWLSSSPASPKAPEVAEEVGAAEFPRPCESAEVCAEVFWATPRNRSDRTWRSRACGPTPAASMANANANGSCWPPRPLTPFSLLPSPPPDPRKVMRSISKSRHTFTFFDPPEEECVEDRARMDASLSEFTSASRDLKRATRSTPE
mmetsp:Transcript_5814/g.12109  ORF Transcript_5814/g.12109 Transcript_5814/m.12109 type:complete len:230 (-) Transcript_5814:268-957(-)